MTENNEKATMILAQIFQQLERIANSLDDLNKKTK